MDSVKPKSFLTSSSFRYYIKQIDTMLLCVCPVTEVKDDFNGTLQTGKITSDFEFFTSNPYRQLRRDGKSFIFAVCRLL